MSNKFKILKNENGVVLNSSFNITQTSFTSLKTALMSYFRTSEFIKSIPNYEENLCERPEYIETYSNTIFYFHHFIELTMKDILRDVDPILATKPFFNDITKLMEFSNLISTERANSEIIEEFYSVEYNDSLSRIIQINKLNNTGDLEINNSDVDTTIFKLFLDYQSALQDLNHLRNRLWHRGTFVLKISALDDFLGGHILPFILKLSEFEKYKKFESKWKYTKFEIDPIEKIIESIANYKDYSSVATYKAIGLACYRSAEGNTYDSKNNKLDWKVFESRECFVCSEESLHLYEEVVDGKINTWETEKAKCQACGLYLIAGMKNPSDCGLSDVEEIFTGERNKSKFHWDRNRLEDYK